MNPISLSAAAWLAACAVMASAGAAEIVIDGVFDDWQGVVVEHTDPSGDVGAGVDFGRLWLADDDRFLFLRVEVGPAMDLSENNALRLYLDTDADAGTGLAVNGIGAELEWRPGARTGTFFHAGQTTAVYHDHIRFRSGPTVTSTVFEIAIGRDTLPDGVHPLFLGDEVRVVLVDGNSGDVLPDSGSTVSYTLDTTVTPVVTPRSFDRLRPGHLRIATHNVLASRLFNPVYEDSFERLYTAVEPDILHLQELSNFTALEARDRIAGWLGGTWYAAGVADCKTVSRYPILDFWALDGNLVALIDTTSATGTPILFINAHLPCCANDAGRQDEVDAIVAFIRDAYAPGGVVTIDAETPVLIAGDLNLVGLAQQLETLLTGDIQDELEHGPDAAPDPDGTDLTSIVSRLTEKRMGYTWRNDGSSFWPGHLDYLIYSDSNLARRHDFIVYTPEMSAAALATHGLEAADSVASDHLLFCADFAAPCTADIDGDGSVTFADLLAMLSTWGPCVCAADLDASGAVDFADLLILLSTWGECY